MTRQTFLVPGIDQISQPDSLTLHDGEAHHMRVKRIAVGESVDLVDGSGWRAQATLQTTNSKGVTLQAQPAVYEPAPQPHLVLVQALVKGSKEEQIVEMATEVGVHAVITWQAERSISRWVDNKVERQVGKLQDAARAATKQSRRSHIPQVLHARNVEQIYCHLSHFQGAGGATTQRVLVAHESAHDNLENVLSAPAPTGAVAIVIGPEGGISPAELADFSARGADLVKVGNTVMRAVTAGVVTLALVRSAWQERENATLSK